MLGYKIKNYEFDMLPQSEWKDYLWNTKMCGMVTNTDDVNFGIPIVVDMESFNLEPLPYPHLMCKSTKGIFEEEDYLLCPWIIKCDINDVIKLLNGDENYVVALYHEIGHFHYSDEQDQSSSGDKCRMQQLMNGKVSKDELQADSVAAEFFGKEKVIKSLKAAMTSITMNPAVSNSPMAKLVITELKLRIEALES